MKDLIKKLKDILTGANLDEAKKKEVESQLAELEAIAPAHTPAPAGPPAAGATPPALDESTRQMILALEGQVKALTDALNAETAERKKQAEAMAQRLKEENQKKLQDYIKRVTEGKEARITPAEMKEKWQTLLEKDFEATSKIIDALPVNPAIAGVPDKPKTDKKTTIPGAATLEHAGLPAIREQIAKLTTISDN